MFGTNRKACHWHAGTATKGCPKTKHLCCTGSEPRGSGGPWLEQPAGHFVAAGCVQSFAGGCRHVMQLC